MATRRRTDDDDDVDDEPDEDDDDDDVEVLMFRGKGARRAVEEWLGMRSSGSAGRHPANGQSSSSRSRDRAPRRKAGYFGD